MCTPVVPLIVPPDIFIVGVFDVPIAADVVEDTVPPLILSVPDPTTATAPLLALLFEICPPDIVIVPPEVYTALPCDDEISPPFIVIVPKLLIACDVVAVIFPPFTVILPLFAASAYILPTISGEVVEVEPDSPIIAPPVLLSWIALSPVVVSLPPVTYIKPEPPFDIALYPVD